jgi:uncharacterized membrane protein YfcA
LIAVFATVTLIVISDMVCRKGATDPEPTGLSKPVWARPGTIAKTISAMMGIGGGSVCVPMLNFLGFDIRRAVGTLAAIGFVMGMPGTVIYMATEIG